jgi:membrane protein DedA with SNARE-associated domain
VPEWLLDLFARYGYAVVFVGVFLENAGLPVPGETALVAGAVLAQMGRLSLPGAILTAVAGAILGDNLGFLIGRRGGRALLVRYGPLIGLTPHRLRQFDAFFHRHGPRTVFIARFVTGLRVFGAVMAGASELRWRTFLFYNATGALAWATTFGLLGYAVGGSWDTLERWIGRTSLVLLILAVALAVLVIRRGRQNRDE